MDRSAHGVDHVDDKFDDEDYPAYSMGRAADMLATSQGFLRKRMAIDTRPLNAAAAADGNLVRTQRQRHRGSAHLEHLWIATCRLGIGSVVPRRLHRHRAKDLTKRLVSDQHPSKEPDYRRLTGTRVDWTAHAQGDMEIVGEVTRLT